MGAVVPLPQHGPEPGGLPRAAPAVAVGAGSGWSNRRTARPSETGSTLPAGDRRQRDRASAGRAAAGRPGRRGDGPLGKAPTRPSLRPGTRRGLGPDPRRPALARGGGADPIAFASAE